MSRPPIHHRGATDRPPLIVTALVLAALLISISPLAAPHDASPARTASLATPMSLATLAGPLPEVPDLSVTPIAQPGGLLLADGVRIHRTAAPNSTVIGLGYRRHVVFILCTRTGDPVPPGRTMVKILDATNHVTGWVDYHLIGWHPRHTARISDCEPTTSSGDSLILTS